MLLQVLHQREGLELILSQKRLELLIAVDHALVVFVLQFLFVTIRRHDYMLFEIPPEELH